MCDAGCVQFLKFHSLVQLDGETGKRKVDPSPSAHQVKFFSVKTVKHGSGKDSTEEETTSVSLQIRGWQFDNGTAWGATGGRCIVAFKKRLRYRSRRASATCTSGADPLAVAPAEA